MSESENKEKVKKGDYGVRETGQNEEGDIIASHLFPINLSSYRRQFW